jgi:ABC-type glutathione transport system ATPase component
MHLERGIAIIYITHDLATAYQISDNIVVLYRGAVVEAWAVDLVVKQPQHPYTQLLVSSIPMASPERTWSIADGTGTAGLQLHYHLAGKTAPSALGPAVSGGLETRQTRVCLHWSLRWPRVE